MTGRQEIHHTLRPYDILCGRCKTAYHNVGNRRFRVTMSLNLEAYMRAKSKCERTILIASLVNYLTVEVGARFLKPVKGDGEGYVELGTLQAREKVGHALRDMSVAKRQTTVTAWTKQHKRERLSSRKEQASKVQPIKAVSMPMSKPSSVKRTPQQKVQKEQLPAIVWDAACGTTVRQEPKYDSIWKLQQKTLQTMLKGDDDEIKGSPRRSSMVVSSCLSSPQTDFDDVKCHPNRTSLVVSGICAPIHDVSSGLPAYDFPEGPMSILERMARGEWGTLNSYDTPMVS